MEQALKWWKPFLQSSILREPFFPKQIDRIGKPQSGDLIRRFELLQGEIAALYGKSKNETGAGYLVKTATQHFRRTGSHDLPDCIVFETADDYLHFTRKKKEWELFIGNYELLISNLPHLQAWAVDNPLLLTLPEVNWQGIIHICQYFIANPRPDLYVRQLPIQVHTKFIEDSSSLLSSLLDFLIPQHIRNKGQRKFAERYFLQRDEPLIRIRILDEKLAIHSNIMDLSIRLPDFEKTGWDCNSVVITENKMNFLTLPPVPSAIAIWSGGGFNVSHLRHARWLESKNIFYWGDIDEHGFQILHQLRSYYGQTQSVMMDIQTFDRFQHFAVAGERNKADTLSLLTEYEAELYELLKSRPGSNRLEQEKIPQDYVNALFAVLK